MKVVEKFFSNPQMTPDNARMINQSLQRAMECARVCSYLQIFENKLSFVYRSCAIT